MDRMAARGMDTTAGWGEARAVLNAYDEEMGGTDADLVDAPAE